jgi:hypothetical protein
MSEFPQGSSFQVCVAGFHCLMRVMMMMENHFKTFLPLASPARVVELQFFNENKKVL